MPISFPASSNGSASNWAGHSPQRPARSETPVPASRALRSIAALMLREMSTTYGRSAGGYLWAVLEPAGTILFMTFVISTGLRVSSPALGESFTLFYASGMFPFMLYLRVSAKVGNAIPFSRALLSYPGVAWIDAVLARFALSVITLMVTFLMVISVVIYGFGLDVTYNFGAILTSCGMTLMLSLGVGTLMAFLFPTYPAIASLWSILTAPLLLISGVIFIFDDMPAIARDYLWYNPLVHVIGEMRSGFYPEYRADYVSPIYVYLIGLVSFTVGLILLKNNYRKTYQS
jgi:capsular polysaccharide transport system permease protein